MTTVVDGTPAQLAAAVGELTELGGVRRAVTHIRERADQEDEALW